MNAAVTSGAQSDDVMKVVGAAIREATGVMRLEVGTIVAREERRLFPTSLAYAIGPSANVHAKICAPVPSARLGFSRSRLPTHRTRSTIAELDERNRPSTTRFTNRHRHLCIW